MKDSSRLNAVNLAGLVLAVLEQRAMHGYGIAREIERLSSDALSYGEGSLYPALKRLEVDGFIVGSWDTDGPGGAKRVYRITPSGLGELTRLRVAWIEYSKSVDKVLIGQFQPGRA